MKNKMLLLLLSAVCLSANVFAQPVIKKQKVFGADYTDFFTTMALTKDGGTIIGGSSNSGISGDKTEKNRDSTGSTDDYWIIKTDSTGTIEWDKTIGGNGNDILTDIQQTKDGGYLLGGYSESGKSGDKSGSNYGPVYSPDYWVVKLDSAGNIQWDKTIGGSDDDYLYSIWQTNDNGYIIGGASRSNISGDKTENVKGGASDPGDYWVVKLNKNGVVEWDKTIGGNYGDGLGDLQQTNDGGYILGGTSSSKMSFDKTENSRGGQDYWIVKLNKTGVIEWDKTVGGNDEYEIFVSLQQTTDEGYIIGGYSSSDISGEKTENSRGGYDYWLVKLDSSGNKQLDKTLGGNATDFFSAVQQTRDLGYIVAGYSDSKISGEKTEESRGDNDYWIVKLDSTGNLQWDKTIGGNKTDQCYAITQVKKDVYIVGGLSESNISGDKTKPRKGFVDYWIVLLNYTTEARAQTKGNEAFYKKINNKSFIVYPNPAKDILHVETTGKATVTLTNQSGKIILTKTINNNGEINVSHLPAGLYYVKNNETGEVQKVIITH